MKYHTKKSNRLKKVLYVRQYTDNVPLIRFAYRLLRFFKLFIRERFYIIQARLNYPHDKIDLKKICLVDPHEIKYCIMNKFDKWENYCRILGGEWDRSEKLFDDKKVYQAFKQKFKEGKKWEETIWYQRVLNQMSNGRVKWDCKTKEEFDERLKKLDSLYYQIKRNGYKTQRELSGFQGWFSRYDKPVFLDEITVVIDKHGQLLFFDGQHRLSIAKILDIPLIPIIILVRHKKWMDFRSELISFIVNHQDGTLYQPFSHPDLQDLPFKLIGVPFDLIKDNLTVSKGTLLDIGANFGYFCFRFEDEGFDCYVLEENKKYLYFIEKLKMAENKTFKIINESLFEYHKNNELKFDVVLALNGLHRYLESKDTFLNLIEFLKRIRVKELFLTVFKLKEFQNRKVYKTFNQDQFINFIFENSCLKKTKFIGELENGRCVYKFIL